MLDSSGMPKIPSRAPWANRNRDELKALLAEHARRGMEALRLYRPLPFQEEFHASRFRETLLMKATRAGGSVAGFAEDARAALGCDPYDKYPKKDGVIVCVGWGEGHIGRVIHRLLFRPGAFSIIKDRQTGEYRPFRPWAPDVRDDAHGEYGDGGREDESEPAPPLIPKRRIKGKIAWVKRSHNIFAKVELDTGWTLYAANSAGDPEQFQGFKVHLYHIDEDIDRPGWYTEATSRTQEVSGMLRWTAMPHGRNGELIELSKRCEEQEGQPNQISKKITATMYHNPYLPKKALEENARIWMAMGEDVFNQRALGRVTMDDVRMYPTFDERIHDYHKQESSLCKLLQERRGQAPHEWCRYLIVDPGHTICAVLFVAVPPPDKYGDHIYVEDELYIKQATVAMFGQGVKRKVGDKSYQAFIIDAHGGRLTGLVGGPSPREQYAAELARLDVFSVETKSDFLMGSDQLEGRENALRAWLSIRPDGLTKLLVNRETCPNFCKEMVGFMKKFDDKGGRRIVLNEGNRRAHTHLVECAEYAAAHGCRYVQPPSTNPARKLSWAEQNILETENRRKARIMAQGGSTINLGPMGSGEFT